VKVCLTISSDTGKVNILFYQENLTAFLPVPNFVVFFWWWFQKCA